MDVNTPFPRIHDICELLEEIRKDSRISQNTREAVVKDIKHLMEKHDIREKLLPSEAPCESLTRISEIRDIPLSVMHKFVDEVHIMLVERMHKMVLHRMLKPHVKTQYENDPDNVHQASDSLLSWHVARDYNHYDAINKQKRITKYVEPKPALAPAKKRRRSPTPNSEHAKWLLPRGSRAQRT